MASSRVNEKLKSNPKKSNDKVIQNKIDDAKNAVRLSVKKQIVVGGIKKALEEIALGDVYDIAEDAINELEIFANEMNDTSNILIDLGNNAVPLLQQQKEVSVMQ